MKRRLRAAMRLGRRITVLCKHCDEWIDEESADVQFVDISEGPEGEDLLTFNHLTCKTQSQSVRRT